VFRSAGKYEKRLLHQDYLWAFCNEFGLVPNTVNSIRFNKVRPYL
jgi:hypothetical protein